MASGRDADTVLHKARDRLAEDRVLGHLLGWRVGTQVAAGCAPHKEILAVGLSVGESNSKGDGPTERRRKPGAAVGGEGGSAVLETAFILPLFLLLTFGVVEFGRAWLIVNTMNHAAREAVRFAATTAPLTANDPTVVSKAKGILAAAGVNAASVTNTAPAGAPPAVTVTATHNFAFLTGIGPIFNFSFSGTVPLSSSATMRYER